MRLDEMNTRHPALFPIALIAAHTSCSSPPPIVTSDDVASVAANQPITPLSVDDEARLKFMVDETQVALIKMGDVGSEEYRAKIALSLRFEFLETRRRGCFRAQNPCSLFVRGRRGRSASDLGAPDAEIQYLLWATAVRSVVTQGEPPKPRIVVDVCEDQGHVYARPWIVKWIGTRIARIDPAIPAIRFAFEYLDGKTPVEVTFVPRDGIPIADLPRWNRVTPHLGPQRRFAEGSLTAAATPGAMHLDETEYSLSITANGSQGSTSPGSMIFVTP